MTIFVLQFLLEFQRKIIDFDVLFDAIRRVEFFVVLFFVEFRPTITAENPPKQHGSALRGFGWQAAAHL